MPRSLVLIILLASLLITAVIVNPTHPTQAQTSPEPLAPTDDFSIYLPIILRPRAQSIFGAETYDFSDKNFTRAYGANLYWLRTAVFDWSKIEAVRGTYNWSSVEEANLVKVAKEGYKLIATVKFTPTWAQKWAPYSCGPIKDTAWTDFYNFVKAMVERYSVAPYNIQYWEFGNEPDVDPNFNPSFLPDNPFGCWGDGNDPYYGGGYYAEMLKRAYPAVKAASQSSKVLIGGLLLDCDPTQSSNVDCKSGKFFQGIINNDGGNYFDIVSFHSYIVQLNHKILDEDSPKWINRGGQINGKINFLKEVMALKGINKPLMLTELAMKWKSSDEPPTEEFLDFQADVVVTSYARTWGEGLLGETWYTLEDTNWLYSGLFIGNTPKPAYHALVFMTKQLHDCTLTGALSLPTGLRGYEFNCPYKQRKIQLIWTWDSGTAITMPKPAGLLKMYDKLGAEIMAPPDPLSILHPVYLEFQN